MSFETFNAILVGLGLGISLGLLKTWLLWYRRNPFKPKKSGKQPGAQGIIFRSIISYFLNIIILGLLYLSRSILPLPLIPLLLASATALIFCGLVYPIHSMFRK